MLRAWKQVSKVEVYCLFNWEGFPWIENVAIKWGECIVYVCVTFILPIYMYTILCHICGNVHQTYMSVFMNNYKEEVQIMTAKSRSNTTLYTLLWCVQSDFFFLTQDSCLCACATAVSSPWNPLHQTHRIKRLTNSSPSSCTDWKKAMALSSPHLRCTLKCLL